MKEYFYLGTYSKKGNNRVSAYTELKMAWLAACHGWPAKPLRNREEAVAWLRMSVSEKLVNFYLRRAEKAADRLLQSLK